jgi:hypothetical protein
MNIVIINGNPDAGNNDFERYLYAYQVKLRKAGHYTKTFVLRDMWINTVPEPAQGFSTMEQDSAGDLQYVFNCLPETHLLVFASPLSAGLASLLLKLAQERILLYLEKSHKGSSQNWYERTETAIFPMLGTIFQLHCDSSHQDFLLNKLIQERISTDSHHLLSFCITTESGPTDAACETLLCLKNQRFIDEDSGDSRVAFNLK